MHQATLGQVFMLCSMQGLGYDGLPASLPETWVKDDPERREVVRLRIFWYAFVEESMLSGLKGNNLRLTDDEDLAAIEDNIEKQPLVIIPGNYHTAVKMSSAPVQFGVSLNIIGQVFPLPFPPVC